jgi:anthranilate phosphoribosyltransferase
LTKDVLDGYNFEAGTSLQTSESLTFLPSVMDTSPLRSALHQLAQGLPLSRAEAAAAFGVIMEGGATPAQSGAFLLGLRVKGETGDELAGAADALRSAMVRLPVEDPDALVDTCGTGGGQVGTINLSTAAAFIVAGAGVPVAKHGNRSYTSRSGSADVLEALGVDIGLNQLDALELLRSTGFVFLYAPTYHPAMRHVAPVRKELGVSTIMNLVGPLVNPAGVRRQIVGVSDAPRAPLMAAALSGLRARHALVLHAAAGMDEISPAGRTSVWEVEDGEISRWELNPVSYGLECDDLDGLAGGDPTYNARQIEQLLEGQGRPPLQCAALLNASAALYVSARGWTFEEAVSGATRSLESGAAGEVLQRVREWKASFTSTSE